MSNYNRDDRSGGGRSGGRRFGGGGGGGFRGRDSGRREMFDAVCDECGNNCKVPFRPSGDKPIYCSDCFERKGGGSPQRSNRGGSGRSGYGGSDNTNKQLLEQMSSLNDKLGRILTVIESKVEKKPAEKIKEAKKEIKKVTKKVEKVKEKKVSKKKAKKSTSKK